MTLAARRGPHQLMARLSAIRVVKVWRTSTSAVITDWLREATIV